MMTSKELNTCVKAYGNRTKAAKAWDVTPDCVYKWLRGREMSYLSAVAIKHLTKNHKKSNSNLKKIKSNRDRMGFKL